MLKPTNFEGTILIAKHLASEATARIVLDMPFSKIDLENSVLIGVESNASCEDFCSQNMMGLAINLGTISLVHCVDDNNFDNETVAWGYAHELCQFADNRLSDETEVEPHHWFEIMERRAATIATEYRDSIFLLAGVLLVERTVERECCEQLIYAAVPTIDADGTP